MDKLRELSYNKVESVSSGFRRFLFEEIDLNDQLIAIRGARGSGKTTLLLQLMKQTNDLEQCLYLSLDNIMLQDKPLLEVVDYYYKLGVRYLFLDEVHKYEGWSTIIKNLYDHYGDLKIVFTASSLLELYQGQADLSRRLSGYDLPGMSFREFLQFDQNLLVRPVTLTDLLRDHVPISREYKKVLGSPLAHFKRYLQLGYYPYFKENEEKYSQRLIDTINQILETDLMAVGSFNYTTVRKLKALLSVISQSVPFKPNISSLSKKIEVKRETVLHYMDLLERAAVLILLQSATGGISRLNKPDKVYLENTNILYALSEGIPEKGNIRETFFLNQISKGHKVKAPVTGDFIVDDIVTFEVGGKSKTKKQIEKTEKAFVVADDIETGSGNKIPLWLFGFFY